ncbi:MAG: hypothetical protein MUF19_04290 [Candidatus Pacebacteria bacterium]|jgi:hypothetical protein|nr:hypothetical protein [Candidatus Paceibacterota bacterium]
MVLVGRNSVTTKSNSSRKHPRIYCYFGEGRRRFYRFCPTKPFPEEGAKKLRAQIKEYFASLQDATARRALKRDVSVSFYLGRDGKQPLAGSIRVVEGSEDVYFAQDNLRKHMEEAWQVARTKLGIKAAA